MTSKPHSGPSVERLREAVDCLANERADYDKCRVCPLGEGSVCFPNCGAWVAAKDQLDGLLEQYQAALEALHEADRLASVAHDAIWDKSVASNALLHDNDDIRSAQWAIWKLHEIVRPLIVAQSLKAQIAEKRNDKDFQDRLARTIEDNKDILDRLADGDSSPASGSECPRCEGRGRLYGQRPVRSAKADIGCPDCGGTGKVSNQESEPS